MENFIFKQPPKLIFGVGAVAGLPALLKSYGKRVLLVTGAESFPESEKFAALRQRLDDCGAAHAHEIIPKEPSPELIDGIVTAYRGSGIQCVAAIGGGSVLDGGKAIAAMLTESGSVLEFLEGVGHREPEGGRLPFVAVPTTSGTGSEATCNAVISQVGKNGFKKSLRHDRYMPDLALVDPSLTMECPRKLTINCAMDAFTQLVESYLSTKASPLTDDLALGGLTRLKDSLSPLSKGEGTLGDRANMAYAAFISGITLTNAGLGAVHGMASVIGGLFPVPHGVVCGTLMAKANEVSLRKLWEQGDSGSALQKYTKLGKLFSDRERESDRYYQESFVALLKDLTASLEIDRLSAYGITATGAKAIARECVSKNNPVQLDREEFENILLSRIEQ